MKVSLKFSPTNKRDGDGLPFDGQDRAPSFHATKKSAGKSPVIIFRIHDHWYALRQHLVYRVAPFNAPRPLPGKTNDIIRGLVYATGACYLCFSFHGLLKVTAPDESSLRKNGRSRLIVMETEEDHWAFVAEEIITTAISISVSHDPKKQVKIATAWGDITVLQTFDLHGEKVTLLDEETLFTALSRSLVF